MYSIQEKVYQNLSNLEHIIIEITIIWYNVLWFKRYEHLWFWAFEKVHKNWIFHIGSIIGILLVFKKNKIIIKLQFKFRNLFTISQLIYSKIHSHWAFILLSIFKSYWFLVGILKWEIQGISKPLKKFTRSNGGENTPTLEKEFLE